MCTASGDLVLLPVSGRFYICGAEDKQGVGVHKQTPDYTKDRDRLNQNRLYFKGLAPNANFATDYSNSRSW